MYKVPEMPECMTHSYSIKDVLQGSKIKQNTKKDEKFIRVVDCTGEHTFFCCVYDRNIDI